MTLEEMTAQRDALLAARLRGVRTVEIDGGRVTYKATATRDSGSAYCKVCRKKMIEWNDYSQPSFSPVLESLNDDRPLPSSLRPRPHR